MTNPAPIRAIGEIAIRCNDLTQMVAFYRDIVGLPVLKDFSGDGGMVFFKVAEGYGAHTAVLALFDKTAGRPDIHDSGSEAPETGARSSLHHLALTVDYERQDALCRFLEAHGVAYRVQSFDWIGWRGVFIRDPEGNTVEFVAGAPREAAPH